ncbi:OmpH family outer membrane protein [Altererythrobacter sp. H2]|uniref:OmpH family outer membrane protein n=1 Tax=Altererythrobacter sp. H2 TaxID=3108391 RepID=UPI002B4BD971|nr:OmpH family outer membrane protein [Altererythrobacter sp. H2]WRK97122.1 OmpH family outer membrane protein [Altererythrobacter sp. H2]
MNISTKLFAGAALAAVAMASAPASAQLNGMATASPEAVIVRSAARIAAYQQIDQQYSQAIQQVRALRQEMNTLQQQLDTNGDGQLTEQEVAAGSAQVTQLQQKDQQANELTQPIALAQYYVIEQLINDYANAQNQVLQAKKVQVLLSPDAIQQAPEGFNITNDILKALDTRLPTVTITPPANWQPRRDTVSTHQTVQQVLMAAAQQQAAMQQQQQQQPAPQGR